MSSVKRPWIDPDSYQYQRKADSLARDHVDIHQCQKCWNPVINGYCCHTCGSQHPRWTKEQEDEWNEGYDP
jgi:hypothetical protein